MAFPHLDLSDGSAESASYSWASRSARVIWLWSGSTRSSRGPSVAQNFHGKHIAARPQYARRCTRTPLPSDPWHAGGFIS